MVVSCVGENCSNSCKNSPELSFHRLSRLNDDKREIRVLANAKIHGPLPKQNNLFLSSNHFEKSCFERYFKLTFHF